MGPMVVESYHIRQATAADLDALVDLHYRVFNERSHRSLVLGRRFVRASYRWYCQAPTAFALVGEINGEIKGSCTVNQGPYHRVFKANAVEVARAVLRRPSLLVTESVRRRFVDLIRGRGSRERILALKTNAAYLACLAVDVTARGSGMGSDLIRTAVHECERRGWRRIVGAVHRNNVPARFMYRTLGFEDAPDLSHDDLVGIVFNGRREAVIPTQRGELC